MFIEIESNPNCEDSIFLRFKELGPARRISQVKSYEQSSKGEWCDIVGWSEDPDHPMCPAFAQPVEDSGTGLAYLVFGGIWGVRLKPVSFQEEWSLESSHQWGETYLSLSDERDVQYEES